MAEPAEEEVTRGENRDDMNWKGKHVLVTGGAGFIGSHLVDRLIGCGAKITVFDNFSTGFREHVRPRDALRVIEGSLLNGEIGHAMRGVDFVFHLAANADIKDNLKEPRKCVEQNIVATQNVLEAMRASSVRDIAFSSTGSVYGETTAIPTPEDAPFPVQTSLYATSKVAAEGLLTSYALGFNLRIWIFRFASILGPRYTHGHVIDFWRKIKRDPTSLEILGNGKQKKSYLNVVDCVEAMLTAINRRSEAINVFNLGHTDWIEVNDSVAIIARAMGVSPNLRYTGGERGWVGDSPRILLDTTRIRALGWSPTRTIEDSILETLQFLSDNAYLEQRS